MLNRTNLVLVVLLVAVAAASAVLRVDYTKPNFEILPDMKYSPAWFAFEENPNFANGTTLQRPVFGTIARGELPLHYAATVEDAVRAGEELRNPFDSNAADDAASEQPASSDEEAMREAGRRQASAQRGGDVYRVFCISCHGPAGAGDGPVTRRGFPPPPSLLTGKSRQMKDGQLFHVLTYGQGSMDPMAAQLSRDRRWDVINFIRDMQSKAPATAELPETNEALDERPPEKVAKPEVPAKGSDGPKAPTSIRLGTPTRFDRESSDGA